MSQLQTFLISIAILEGRHYIWPTMNSVVIIKIDKKKKHSAVKFSTDCPYYNEYFVFEFTTTLEQLLDKTIKISVIQPGGIIKRRKTLGSVVLDVATVWNQIDHQFYQKWAILNSPKKDLMGGTRGYLKLNISILSKGEIPKFPLIPNTDDIERNLLLASESKVRRQKAYFIFDVCYGEDFDKFITKKENHSISFYLEITFADSKVKTTNKKCTRNPVWNERLTLIELFPPLCQRIKIELHSSEYLKKLTPTKYINIYSISNDRNDGFLPTFGPTFLHFYSKDHLEGYTGKILIALTTKLSSNILEDETKFVAVQPLLAIKQESFFKNRDFIIIGEILNVTCINKKFASKEISFELACGPSSVSIPTKLKAIPINKSHYYLDIGQEKLQLLLNLSLPNIEERIYFHNMVNRIVIQLRSKLENAENFYRHLDHLSRIPLLQTIFIECVELCISSALKFIEIVSKYEFKTILDQQRHRIALEKMKAIQEITKSIQDMGCRKRSFKKIEQLSITIETLADEIEAWPLIYLWMICSNKRVAYYIIKPQDIIYSSNLEVRGINSGVLQTIFFRTNSEEISDFYPYFPIACIMDVYLIMTTKTNQEETLLEFPKLDEKHNFTCKAHLFQGRIIPGSDKSGLCDPYIHLIIDRFYQSTKVIKNSLNPVWDQSLIFTNITLYGSIEFIKENPPNIIMELFDKDEFGRHEMIGRTLIKPTVISENETISLQLSWYKIKDKFGIVAEILASFELNEISIDNENQKIKNQILPIPSFIRPNLINYRIDVVFWGVRNLKRLQLLSVNRPKIVIECGDKYLQSDQLINARKHLNFPNPIKSFEVILAEELTHTPPLLIKMYDCRNFGINIYAGVHVTPIKSFIYFPMTKEDILKKFQALERISIQQTSNLSFSFTSRESSIATVEQTVKEDEKNVAEVKDVEAKMTPQQSKRFSLKGIYESFSTKKSTTTSPPIINENKTVIIEDDEDFDWWTKFYASLEPIEKGTKITSSQRNRLTIYGSELEKQREFGGFSDMLQSFPIYKGKRTGDEIIDKSHITAIFKGALKIYRWPLLSSSTSISSDYYLTTNGLPLENGYFQDFPTNRPLRYILRVYCVRALNLRPKDLNGRSDPYLVVSLNNQIVNDRKNYVSKQINPIFGRYFEFNAIFPKDHTLIITVYDWDLTTSDDLIGETRIDLENRVYTKHRAHCGLPENYYESGYCQWRDPEKPVTILAELCHRSNIEPPEYRTTSVRVASNEFYPQHFQPSGNLDYDRQVLALTALRHWHEIPVVGCYLVPEHIETRSLYDPNKPGIEQGKLQMWIDILLPSDLPIPKPVNITPRQAVGYHLRVIVWNVDQITLDETDFITGERKSDIYVVGWLTSPESAQNTDIHYRSISGEGNFNWRFIFAFKYLSTENCIVINKKQSIFDYEDSEFKIPCRLTLQVWDSDSFSKDDFLGVTVLELAHLPRGVREAKHCTLQLFDENAPVVNLFKIKRIRGWWPFKNIDKTTNSEVYAGCAELELELLTDEDAERSPAGFGRDEPQALPKPKRPDCSFSWFRNPLKAAKYVLKIHRWKILKVFLICFAIMLIVLGIYAFPGYTVKRLLGA